MQLNTTIVLDAYPTICTIPKLASFHVRSIRWTTRTDEAQRGISLPETDVTRWF